jgi:Cdc6-like AAA superfamily ATPase
MGQGKTLVTKEVLTEIQKVYGAKSNFPLILISTINSLDTVYRYPGFRKIFL